MLETYRQTGSIPFPQGSIGLLRQAASPSCAH